MDPAPDERAAGVILGADPYRELELYLEKVNEEIGEVFEQWKVNRLPASEAIPIPDSKSPEPPKRRRRRSTVDDLDIDGLLTEFNSIVANELQGWPSSKPPRARHRNRVSESDSEGMASEPLAEAGTQTSPALSSSSSFTWASDCSLPLDASSSNASSRDSLSDSLSPERDEPESGIGTASPPHTRGVREDVQTQTHTQGSRSAESLQGPEPLAAKSSSAPLLNKKDASPDAKDDGAASMTVLKQPRSHSERHLAEIEAAEACKWLRAAGFPQYAQMYEDLQFPIDVSGVQKDHPFLDPDSLQSLFRRLQALNRCAKMKVDNLPKNKVDDSDEDDHCALSENWTFQPESRRWSRVCDVAVQHVERLQALSASSQVEEVDRDDGDADAADGDLEPDGEGDVDADDGEADTVEAPRYGSLPPGALAPAPVDVDLLAVRFRRTGSERLKDSAKALLRRMESLKSRRRKRQYREGVVISGPQVLDLASMQRRIEDLNCVDVDTVVAIVHADANGSPTRCRRLRRDDAGALSDSEATPTSWRHQYLKDANSNHTKLLEFVDADRDKLCSSASSRQPRTSSINLAEVAVYRDRSGSSELTGSQESSSTLASQADSDHEDGEATPRHKAVVVRWHSFQRGSCRPESCLVQPEDPELHLRPMGALSCGQLLVLRKLSLLKLTAFMERFCPTHRTGWNWELPKFIRKIKTPDYKDKTVFGIPLLLTLQRTGQSLPCCIQQALKWLRANALDQVGLFRKSGVRSRIQKLKVMTETQGNNISYDGQQAYDVADMVKQYFRELPEALLTNKLSETFIAIFQHVPDSCRAEAVQWVLLLLPDEHREALQTLLEFLSQVAAHAEYNQMSPSNLAVCLAPSLFHFHHAPSGATTGRSASASPRRRKTVGVPDARELAENRAAHDCLLYLIKEHKRLFMVSEEILAQCHFNYMEESIPVALEELGSEFQQDWRGYLYACTTALLKEAREKSRGWVNVTCSSDPQVEMAYKKVGDGHPLRLWRVSTEVEAPPQELLHRVLRGRHVWDNNLLKWRVVARPDPQGEVFQYVCASMPPLPAKDYCVLRSWRTDLPKGACVIVETSVEHADAPVMLGGVRGIVLASRYLIEPCGSGKSRIMHLSRVDTKGRTPDWYNKSYGHICALYLSLIRGSFKHNTDGPESKV